VTKVVVGYSGGARKNPTYENHEGHLESIQVTYDPAKTMIAPAGPFWMGEAYHQDYATKNPLHYNAYRVGCGRDARINAVWKGR
jgi:peptide methionine sulfoxide reductase MsrA